jgi:hypothetical protein
MRFANNASTADVIRLNDNFNGEACVKNRQFEFSIQDSVSA